MYLVVAKQMHVRIFGRVWRGIAVFWFPAYHSKRQESINVSNAPIIVGYNITMVAWSSIKKCNDKLNGRCARNRRGSIINKTR